MGALCSGKSDVPVSMETHKSKGKGNNVVGESPKVAYELDKAGI